MQVEIISHPYSRSLYGLSGKVENQQYGVLGKLLMDALWREIGQKGFKHKGVNYWVYGAQNSLFVGLELESAPNSETLLVQKDIVLGKYVYWKHVGAYTKLGEVHARIHQELLKNNIQAEGPAVEVYGHWTEDQAKLETEILISVK